ncbi:Hypothetical protein A7982_10055 [Minicystis rosea]|nr:Hypothetical protein A7982_10055 [Minicystis rosea]
MDILREVLSTEWHEATQSDVLRAVILNGLKLLEKEHGAKVLDVKKRRESAPAPADKPSVPSSKRGKKGKG